MDTSKKSHHKRTLINKIAFAFAILSVSISLYFLGWILLTLFKEGFAAINWATFTQNTPPPGSKGGLLNAIVGSLMLVSVAIGAGGTIGIFVAIYFSEYGRNNKFSQITRFINDVLLGTPSVILGLFIYELYVVKVGHFSGWAGVMVLSIIAIPIVVRTTDSVLALIPKELREAAIAIGAPVWKMVLSIIIPLSKTGIITGLILALARIAGETAPLLFTALNNQFWNTDMSKPIASLPTVIFQYAMSPYKDWHTLAWSGALILTLFVFLLNISVRLFFKKKIAIY